jgi:hypothetical protein
MRASQHLNLTVGATRIALDIVPEGLKIVSTDGTSLKKRTLLAFDLAYLTTSGATLLFMPGVQPMVRETGQELLNATVELLDLLEQLAKKGVALKHKARTGEDIDVEACEALAALAGLHGLMATMGDCAANESKFNRLMSALQGYTVLRLRCLMHMGDNAAKMAARMDKMLELAQARLAAVASDEGVELSALLSTPMPTETDKMAGREGDAGPQKAAELASSQMGSRTEDRRAVLVDDFRLHQISKQEAVRSWHSGAAAMCGSTAGHKCAREASERWHAALLDQPLCLLTQLQCLRCRPRAMFARTSLWLSASCPAAHAPATSCSPSPRSLPRSTAAMGSAASSASAAYAASTCRTSRSTWRRSAIRRRCLCTSSRCTCATSPS